MQRDAYGNYITPGTGWGETAAVASANLPTLQSGNVAPGGDQRFTSDTGQGYTLGASTTVEESAPVDYAAIEAARIAAENAAKAAALRGEITNLANRVKSIFDARYGQVDASAGEQVGKLNDRFSTESTDVANQVEGENQKLGAAHAAGGTYDSSYRGNNVDTVTRAGQGQIRDLGTELSENIGKVGGWVSSRKAGYDAEKSTMDLIVSRLAESSDPNELTSIRNSIDAKIASLSAESADNNTSAQNAAALASIAPSSVRAQQLKTTLSQIVAGNADATQKAAIGTRLIESANLSPEEKQQLTVAFQGDIEKEQSVA